MQIFALGVVSVFNQILDGLDEDMRTSIFDAYIKSLDETPATYRADADKVAEWAAACSSPADLKPDADGLEVRIRTELPCCCSRRCSHAP